MAALWRVLWSNRTARAGVSIVGLFLLTISLGGVLMPYSATDMDFVNLLTPPNVAHPFGTDSFGRDVLTRVLLGARVSLAISVSGVMLAAAVGIPAGLSAAWFGGWIDQLFMRFADLLFAFPSFVLALFLMVVLGFGVTNVVLAIALVYVPIFARLARNLALALREEAYVQAARLMGQSTARILGREILPNIMAPILVQVSIAIAFAVIIEAGLSFLGLGVQPPTPSLGVIMADGREYFNQGPWVLTLTGLFISFGLLGLNLLGDGLRDLTDPKLRERTTS